MVNLKKAAITTTIVLLLLGFCATAPAVVKETRDSADFQSKIAATEDANDAIQKIELLPPGPGNTRNSEGDFITLADGRILFVYSYFTDGGADHSTSYLAGRFSGDGGRTWSDKSVTILSNEGGFNTMSVSLLRLHDGRIALFYCRKNSHSDCRPMMRISTDEAKTWSEPTVCIPDAEIGYYVLNNDRAVQLKSGRLLLPVALHNKPDWQKPDWDGFLQCYFSDDAGKTWRVGKTILTAKTAEGKRITTQEPGVVELKDGRVMMFARTNAGCQYVSYSSDGGDTWSELKPSAMLSPCSPATIERIPGTDRLLLVWNNHEDIDPALREYRTPLSLAVSDDEGRTWKNARDLYDDPNGWYCYTAMHFQDGYVLLGHSGGDRRSGGLGKTNITRIPISLLLQ